MEPQFLVLCPAGQATLAVREHKKRKFHAKSRTGCVCCKRRRVKCDETRPGCTRCAKTHRRCTYESEERPECGRWQDECLGNPLDQAVCKPVALVPEACATPRGATSVELLLHHFEQNYDSITEGIDMLLPSSRTLPREHPHLLSATLAVSASHLRHHSSHASAHEIAECHQKWATLQGFQAALKEELDQQRSDALLATAMCLNLLAFGFVEDGQESWASDPMTSNSTMTDSSRLAWLSLQLGLKPLLLATAQFRDASALQPMFEASGVWRCSLNRHGSDSSSSSSADLGFTTTPLLWTGLLRPRATDRFDLDRVLRQPLRVLILLAETPDHSLFSHLQFVGELEPAFVHLLRHADARALWIFGYWLGLLGRYGFWWLRRRVERDFGAIVVHLRRCLITYSDDEGSSEWNQGDGEWNQGEAHMWANLIDDLEQLENDWPSGMRRCSDN
ncbi:hypothetical protein B0J13DRAFT_565480 [Dactylonectria estremocensis]|uniref:Zn(2)-C6 fungal-type domain-containing protein n=1 Tax=Dactylonectria estremocensis TaxID=1079267 RepID=A0A9P9IMX2_9HYPO|nr:hypothetical protein B0J13DRAFT_565480 [Dactylonectria estremocensis]